MATEEQLKLLERLDQEEAKRPQRNINDHILLIDAMNMYLRAWAIASYINSKGHEVGGMTGFLKSLAAVTRQFNPTRVIVVWDGKGGATNRKHINANYKANRDTAAVIKWDVYDTKEDEVESMTAQIERLQDYLACLPVTVLQIPKLEADDIIAYLAQASSKQGHKATIVSMDKDFLQLVDQNVSVWSPLVKVLYNYETAQEKLGVLPENFNIVKALQGDKSDNLRGVKGIGLKTLIKLFPNLVSNPEVTLDEIFESGSQLLESKKQYAQIIADWNTVEINYKLMDLHESVLDDSERSIIYDRVRDLENLRLRIGPFMQLLEQDCIEGITNSTEDWLVNSFADLQNYTK